MVLNGPGGGHGDGPLRAPGGDAESVQRTVWARTEGLKRRHVMPSIEKAGEGLGMYERGCESEREGFRSPHLN